MSCNDSPYRAHSRYPASRLRGLAKSYRVLQGALRVKHTCIHRHKHGGMLHEGEAYTGAHMAACCMLHDGSRARFKQQCVTGSSGRCVPWQVRAYHSKLKQQASPLLAPRQGLPPTPPCHPPSFSPSLRPHFSPSIRPHFSPSLSSPSLRPHFTPPKKI